MGRALWAFLMGWCWEELETTPKEKTPKAQGTWEGSHRGTQKAKLTAPGQSKGPWGLTCPLLCPQVGSPPTVCPWACLLHSIYSNLTRWQVLGGLLQGGLLFQL